MLILPILIVTFINFICAAIGWGVINTKKDKNGKAVPINEKVPLTNAEESARGMMIANLFLSLVALIFGIACYLAEDGRMFSSITPLVDYGKWAVLALMIINLGLSAGAFAKINSADCESQGYIKHSRNSMLVNTILGLLGALFVFDKVPSFSLSDSDNWFKRLFKPDVAAPVADVTVVTA